MTIARHCLRIADPATLSGFYKGVLGMQNFGSNNAPLLGYDAARCLLEMRKGENELPESSGREFYWKTGITVRNLDHAVRYLRQRDYPVSDPQQFKDIGYLCHLKDPVGFSLELLQQGFEGNQKPVLSGHAIGTQAAISHITLRVNNIEAARSYCEEKLGLRLVSVQPVIEYGFCLFFFSDDDEMPPDQDLEAVGNREWLWARPYGLLELQHKFDGTAEPPTDDGKRTGFAGFAMRKSLESELNYVRASDLGNWV